MPYEREEPHSFQNFVANWDSDVSWAFLAVVRTPEEYDRVFHPAGVMGVKRPYHPPESFFRGSQMLVVCRTARDHYDLMLAVEDVREKGDELTLSYRYSGPAELSSGFKNTLTVYVPKKDYAKVRFVENGKELKTLDLRAGQWAVPPAHPSWREQMKQGR